MHALLQLLPIEVRVRRPAELRLELRVGAQGQRMQFQSAKADTGGGNYQLELVGTRGTCRLAARSVVAAARGGTGILVVN